MRAPTYQIPLCTLAVLLDEPPKNEFYDLNFHLKTGDYFGVLAGILGSCIETEKADDDYHLRLLKKTREDLNSLHATHLILPKPQKRSR